MLNIDKFMVKNCFEEVMQQKCIRRIDLVRKRNKQGEEYQSIFIHFKKWPDNQNAQAIRTKLLEGSNINIMYQEPWFWKCYANSLVI